MEMEIIYFPTERAMEEESSLRQPSTEMDFGKRLLLQVPVVTLKLPSSVIMGAVNTTRLWGNDSNITIII